MNTKAIRLYGADDIRLEEFDLPEITEEEVLIRVVTDSVCASTYKAIRQGPAHKRVPVDVAESLSLSAMKCAARLWKWARM